MKHVQRQPDPALLSRDIDAALDALGIKPGETFAVVPVLAPDANAVGAHGLTHARTAREAALKNYPVSGKQRHRILMDLLRRGDAGGTSDEIAEALGLNLYSVKPRLIELRKGGWARTTGETRDSHLGSGVEVYYATDDASAAARERGHTPAAPIAPKRTPTRTVAAPAATSLF